VVKRYTRNPVGAHYGLRDWLLQRLTGVVMALYSVGFAACLLVGPPATYADWRALFTGPFVRLATLFFVVALLYHAWVGMRDIVMDYVKPTGLRLGLQAVIGSVLLLYLIWAASILWGGR
jgi:succinate dehydrogenase / fumarate reductase, membrane anchor subunit